MLLKIHQFNKKLSTYVITGDAVFMENEDERQEYVLSQDGVIYRGTPPRFKELPWTFGQVSTHTLIMCP